MDVVGSEIGQKMRAAIKAKLTELNCYVDDELPDYVMVMVANKRTRSQMEEDLLLFLGDNTLQFVNWLHQVLKKLQEVTVITPPHIVPEPAEVKKTRSSSKTRKERVKKEKKKDKPSKSSSKKSKKKSKSKNHSKRSERKSHKNKKKKKCKDKDKELIRPNVPPLLMNMEKESEPSITDVFAGQILKNHGIGLSNKNSTDVVEIKPIENESNPPLCPIDLSAITTSSEQPLNLDTKSDSQGSPSSSTMLSRETQLERINATELKLQGLKQKLAQQMESMSDDEDMLTIKAEAEELICDFSDELFQDAAATSAVVPEQPSAEGSSQEATASNVSTETITVMPIEAEILPQIELKLPKWPAREKPKAVKTEGTIEKANVVEKEVATLTDNGKEKEERLTPDKELLHKKPKHSSVRSQLDDAKNKTKKIKNSASELSEDNKRLKKSTSVLERPSPASVVMVRPRPRTSASSSNLLMRAMADAQKSLRDVPAKVGPEHKASARVHPIRRTRLPQKINGHDTNKGTGGIVIEFDCDIKQRTNEEYVPLPITKKVINPDYTPTLRHDNDNLRDEAVELDPKDIHYKSANKEKGPIFVVTLDGLDPNMFLAKKMKSEGLINNDNEIIEEQLPDRTIKKEKELADENSSEKSDKSDKSETSEKSEQSHISRKSDNSEKSDHSERSDSASSTDSSATSLNKKRLSDTSEDSNTQVILMAEEPSKVAVAEKRLCDEDAEEKVVKKRKASPIVFDVEVRRPEPPTPVPAPSTLLISPNSSKYEVPPASASATAVSRTERKTVACSAFPLCRYGASCAFTHPPCRFATSCTRRGCAYAHPAASTAVPAMQTSTFIASHVVPAANYKSISTTAGLPNICKYFPNCANHACHFYHPKPCRYGRACVNKLDCNFYHYDASTTKWRSTM